MCNRYFFAYPFLFWLNRYLFFVERPSWCHGACYGAGFVVPRGVFEIGRCWSAKKEGGGKQELHVTWTSCPFYFFVKGFQRVVAGCSSITSFFLRVSYHLFEKMIEGHYAREEYN